MCNILHKNFKKIRQEGYRYKIFDIKDTPCFGHKQKYSKIYADNWIVWDCEYGDGFCFFTSKKEAIRLLKSLKFCGGDCEYGKHYIKRIEYRQGLGKHFENNITNESVQNYVTAICKEFKILELIEVK